MTFPIKKPSHISDVSWKEYKRLHHLYPYVIFPYLSKQKKVESISTYLFTIYRPEYRENLYGRKKRNVTLAQQSELHVIFKGSMAEDIWIFVLPPIQVEALLVTWQSTWPNLLNAKSLKPAENLTVAEISSRSQLMALIRWIRRL